METNSTYKIISFNGITFPKKQYMNMILSKWLRSLKFGNDHYRIMDSDSYFAGQEQIIRGIVENPNTLIKLAVLGDDEDVVLGFCIITDSILHYIYTHKDFRNMKIANTLIGDVNKLKEFTHITNIGRSIWANKERLHHLIFNPWAK